MKKLILLLAALVCFVQLTWSQKVLFSETVRDYSIPGKYGPGLKKFIHGYFQFGLILPVSDTSLKIRIPASSCFTLGFRSKRTLTSHFSFGLDYNIRFSWFNIKQETGKKYPDTIEHNKQRLQYDNLGLGLYFRYTYGKHGNYLGKYIDAGIEGDWYFASVYYTRDKIDKQVHELYISGLRDFESFNSNVFLRAGFNRYAFHFSYRLFRMFKPANYVKDLPPLTAGIEIGLFK